MKVGIFKSKRKRDARADNLHHPFLYISLPSLQDCNVNVTLKLNSRYFSRCCFVNLNLLLFCRFHCPRRSPCLSALLCLAAFNGEGLFSPVYYLYFRVVLAFFQSYSKYFNVFLFASRSSHTLFNLWFFDFLSEILSKHQMSRYSFRGLGKLRCRSCLLYTSPSPRD